MPLAVRDIAFAGMQSIKILGVGDGHAACNVGQRTGIRAPETIVHQSSRFDDLTAIPTASRTILDERRDGVGGPPGRLQAPANEAGARELSFHLQNQRFCCQHGQLGGRPMEMAEGV